MLTSVFTDGARALRCLRDCAYHGRMRGKLLMVWRTLALGAVVLVGSNGCQLAFEASQQSALTDCRGAPVDLATSPEHCGACDVACVGGPNAEPGCQGGKCVLQCASQYADCDGDASNGCEVDLRDAAHCGSCTTACGAGTECVTGDDATSVCALACQTGQTRCGATCVNLQNDPEHCGACDVPATPMANASPACVNGASALGGCAAQWGNCDQLPGNGCEQTLSTDKHCGGCGQIATLPNATATCAEGTAAVKQCHAGWGNCDGVGGNGCETYTLSSVQHCGGCNQPVVTPPNMQATCVNGQGYVQGCVSGWAECNFDQADGCETNINNDLNNCGYCGNQIGLNNVASASCIAGNPKIVCNFGWENCDGRLDNGCESPAGNSRQCSIDTTL